MELEKHNIAYKPTPILLSVVGGSPQVITETLYGIYKSGEAMPEHVYVITTSFGKKQMAKHNIRQQIENFRQDYQIQTEISLPDENIWVIVDDNGVPLSDANSEVQHKVMADFIVEKVRWFTQQKIHHSSIQLQSVVDTNTRISNNYLKNQIGRIFGYQLGYKGFDVDKKDDKVIVYFDKYTIHASIAGGRKSQTFLLGYAMSLFAREHDVVSHVIVDEQGELCRDFYYPKPESCIYHFTDYRGNTKEIDFSKVSVSLAKMPLVLISKNMPSHLLTKQRSYSNTIELFQCLNSPPSIEVDMTPIHGKNNKVTYNVKFSGKKVQLKTRNLAYLISWIKVDEPLALDDGYKLPLLKLSTLATILTEKKQTFSEIPEALLFFDRLQNVDDFIELLVGGIGKEKNLSEIADEFKTHVPANLKGYLGTDTNDKSYFKQELTKELGQEVSNLYIPQEVAKEDSDGSKGISYFKLTVPPENITIFNEPV